MSFLFVNANCPHVFKREISEFKGRIELRAGDDNILLFYDENLWSSCNPILEKENETLIVSGWFINNSYKLNDIAWLYESLTEGKDISLILDDIVSGVFVVYFRSGEHKVVFTDPFAISPHYYLMDDNNRVIVSPSADEISAGIKDKHLSKFLDEQGHLFGRYTSYENVYRFVPGEYLSKLNDELKLERKNLNLTNKEFLNEEVFMLSRKINACFNKVETSVALSAGFDSRLIFATSSPEISYTWGPISSLDVKNAKILSNSRGVKHIHFDFRENEITEEARECCRFLFEGCVKDYNAQFYENYKFFARQSFAQNIAIDGYLGDVLQRGVYGTFSGKFGEVLKIFPYLTSVFLNSEDLIRRRYSKVSGDCIELVVDDFRERTKDLDCLDDLQKAIYYEFVYGRGLRYITTASVCMNGIFKTVVPTFASKYIFSTLVSNKFRDVICYSVFNEVWKHSPQLEKNMISEGFYSPATTPMLIPFKNFIGRFLTNYHPKHMNYTKK